jgi:hypothetical protein
MRTLNAAYPNRTGALSARFGSGAVGQQLITLLAVTTLSTLPTEAYSEGV